MVRRSVLDWLGDLFGSGDETGESTGEADAGPATEEVGPSSDEWNPYTDEYADPEQMSRAQAYMSDGELNDAIESVQDDLSVATFDESFDLQEELDMLEEEEYLRTLIDADVSTLNGMSAGAIQDALKLLEAALGKGVTFPIRRGRAGPH